MELKTIMKKLLAMLAVSSCSCLGVFGSALGYSNPGSLAPANSYTAATSGDEIGYFYGSTAGYTNFIGLWVNGSQVGNFSLDNHTSKFGDLVNFGHVNAGDSIVFALQVQTPGYNVYSDPAMNP